MSLPSMRSRSPTDKQRRVWVSTYSNHWSRDRIVLRPNKFHDVYPATNSDRYRPPRIPSVTVTAAPGDRRYKSSMPCHAWLKLSKTGASIEDRSSSRRVLIQSDNFFCPLHDLGLELLFGLAQIFDHPLAALRRDFHSHPLGFLEQCGILQRSVESVA